MNKRIIQAEQYIYNFFDFFFVTNISLSNFTFLISSKSIVNLYFLINITNSINNLYLSSFFVNLNL